MAFVSNAESLPLSLVVSVRDTTLDVGLDSDAMGGLEKARWVEEEVGGSERRTMGVWIFGAPPGRSRVR